MATQYNLFEDKEDGLASFDEESLPNDQQEDLDDLELKDDWYTGPSLWSTDWTTETIVGQLKRKNIDLNPRFQRRNAWTTSRKSLYIESLLLGLPVPQLILAEEKGRKGNFIVIDGKQRLLTLRQFASDAGDPDFPQLKLVNLGDRPDLNGITYAKLQSEPEFREDCNVFDNQTMRTVVIRNWKDEKYLYSVFLRINTGSVQLSPQELRQALHPGPFSDFIDDVSVEHDGVKNVLKLKGPDFRMRDVELVLRYFAYQNFSDAYEGNLKKFLDGTTRILNNAWDEKKEQLSVQANNLDLALAAVRTIFTQRNEIRKWNGEGYERPINRAVFDVMAYYFSSEAVRTAALAKAGQVKAEFERLCANDRDFLSAIESTTKSLEANKARFNIWADSLSKVLEIEVISPFS